MSQAAERVYGWTYKAEKRVNELFDKLDFAQKTVRSRMNGLLQQAIDEGVDSCTLYSNNPFIGEEGELPTNTMLQLRKLRIDQDLLNSYESVIKALIIDELCIYPEFDNRDPYLFFHNDSDVITFDKIRVKELVTATEIELQVYDSGRMRIQSEVIDCREFDNARLVAEMLANMLKRKAVLSIIDVARVEGFARRTEHGFLEVSVTSYKGPVGNLVEIYEIISPGSTKLILEERDAFKDTFKNTHTEYREFIELFFDHLLRCDFVNRRPVVLFEIPSFRI